MGGDVRCAKARDGAFKVKVNSGGEGEQSFDLSRSPPLTGKDARQSGFWTSHERSNASHELKAGDFRDDGGSLDPTCCWSSRAVLMNRTQGILLLASCSSDSSQNR